MTGLGFCQAGVCTEDADCGANVITGATNICAFLDNGEGSGLCLNRCEPVSCTAPGVTCDDGPALDTNGDGVNETWGCLPVITNNQLIAGRYGCLPGLNIGPGQPCAGGTDCQTGAFCTTLISGGANGFCSQYCADNGNPACDVGNCTGTLEQGIGFCQ